ncbi:MAG TPA: hypothetical protein VEL47_03570 [Myxococcota bacterium]|nr:hypothetical protein [Myxococcota bacterium]
MRFVKCLLALSLAFSAFSVFADDQHGGHDAVAAETHKAEKKEDMKDMKKDDMKKEDKKPAKKGHK